MSEPNRKTVKHFDQPGHCHELTFSCYKWQSLLSNDTWRVLFCEPIERAVKRHQYRLYAFVLMPEHVHLLVQPTSNDSPVSNLLKAIKRPFSYRVKQHLIASENPLLNQLTILKRLGVTMFRFWQEGPGYDRNLTSSKAILSAINYIHENPVRRGMCQRAVDWKWSSARQLVEANGLSTMEFPRVDRLPPELLDEGTIW